MPTKPSSQPDSMAEQKVLLSCLLGFDAACEARYQKTLDVSPSAISIAKVACAFHSAILAVVALRALRSGRLSVLLELPYAFFGPSAFVLTLLLVNPQLFSRHRQNIWMACGLSRTVSRMFIVAGWGHTAVLMQASRSAPASFVGWFLPCISEGLSMQRTLVLVAGDLAVMPFWLVRMQLTSSWVVAIQLSILRAVIYLAFCLGRDYCSRLAFQRRHGTHASTFGHDEPASAAGMKPVVLPGGETSSKTAGGTAQRFSSNSFCTKDALMSSTATSECADGAHVAEAAVFMDSAMEVSGRSTKCYGNSLTTIDSTTNDSQLKAPAAEICLSSDSPPVTNDVLPCSNVVSSAACRATAAGIELAESSVECTGTDPFAHSVAAAPAAASASDATVKMAAGRRKLAYVRRYAMPPTRVMFKINGVEPEDLPSNVAQQVMNSMLASGMLVSGAAVRAGCIELCIELLTADGCSSCDTLDSSDQQDVSVAELFDAAVAEQLLTSLGLRFTDNQATVQVGSEGSTLQFQHDTMTGCWRAVGEDETSPAGPAAAVSTVPWQALDRCASGDVGLAAQLNMSFQSSSVPEAAASSIPTEQPCERVVSEACIAGMVERQSQRQHLRRRNSSKGKKSPPPGLDAATDATVASQLGPTVSGGTLVSHSLATGSALVATSRRKTATCCARNNFTTSVQALLAQSSCAAAAAMQKVCHSITLFISRHNDAIEEQRYLRFLAATTRPQMLNLLLWSSSVLLYMLVQVAVLRTVHPLALLVPLIKVAILVGVVLAGYYAPDWYADNHGPLMSLCWLGHTLSKAALLTGLPLGFLATNYHGSKELALAVVRRGPCELARLRVLLLPMLLDAAVTTLVEKQQNPLSSWFGAAAYACGHMCISLAVMCTFDSMRRSAYQRTVALRSAAFTPAMGGKEL